MDTNIEKKVDAKALADLFGCSISTIYRLSKSGRIPSYQPGGKGHMVRFSPKSLDTLKPECFENNSNAEDKISGPKPKWMTGKIN